MHPSSRNPFWSSVGSIPPLMETYSNFCQRPLHQSSIFSTTTQPYQHSSLLDYDYRQPPVFDHSDYSSHEVAAPLSYNHVPVQHQPPLLPLSLPFFHSHPSMMSPNIAPVHSFHRYDSSIRTSESSSNTDILVEDVMIIEEDDAPSDASPSVDHHAEESTQNYVERAHERLDRHQSIFSLSQSISPLSKSRSRSPPYRQVVIQSKDRVKSSSSHQQSGRVRKHNRKQRTKDLIHEKYLMRVRQPSSPTESSKPDPQIRRSSENEKHPDDKMSRLFEKYASEKNETDVQNPWRPLSLDDCQQLYKYALDKYQCP